jgi:hypothetical protein
MKTTALVPCAEPREIPLSPMIEVIEIFLYD